MATLKILVVDDELGIRLGIERILNKFTVSYPFIEEDFTFQTDTSEDGVDALDKILNNKYDIVLLDNKLPEIEGIEILHKIKEKNIDCEVLMITSFASLDLAVRATNEGAYNFIPKPFTPDEIRNALENVVKHLYLKRLTKNAGDEQKALSNRFLSILSHELKSPINAVESYLRIMKDKQLGNDIELYKKMILRSIDRLNGMRRLISDMLELTRIENSANVVNKQKLDLSLLAKRTIETLEPMANEKNIKIYTNFSENCDFSCNENDLQIIFNNLISNAIKYNKENGEIFFSIKKDNEKIIIVCEDTGIGMSEQETQLLFREFVRIKNEKTRNIEGTGLGLSITKKIVDKYSGKITVKSEINKGTKFTVELPLAL